VISVKDVGKWKHTNTYCGNVEKLRGYGRHLMIYETHKSTGGKIEKYDNIFEIGNISVLTKVKIRIIQCMIQVERPKNWSLDNIVEIANGIKRIEKYNRLK
jgi:hypothetical protein